MDVDNRMIRGEVDERLFKTESFSDDDDEFIIKRSYESDDESETEAETDDIPLSELIQDYSIIQSDIKLEPVDQPVQLPDGSTIQSLQRVKQETDIWFPGMPGNMISRAEYCYKCRICAETFNSRYQFEVHVAKHEIRCVNCKCVYKTWKELEDHEDYCTRRFGR